MARLNALHPDHATGKTKELFNAIQGKLGLVPNMMRTMGHSAPLLEGSLNLSAALGAGTLGAVKSELIALAVAESNSCTYCLSAHSYIGANALKISSDAIADARNGQSADAKTAAILRFAKTLVSKRGQVNDADVATARGAGITDSELCEIVGHVGLNILTNYFNNVADTELDFPLVEAHKTATV